MTRDTSIPALTWIVAGVCAAGLWAPAAGAQAIPDRGQIILTEQLSLPIPLDNPVGLAAIAADSFLVWDQASLVMVSENDVVDIDTGPAVRIGAATKIGGRVYLFDAVLREVVAVNITNERRAVQTNPAEIPDGGSIISAVFTECGLVVLWEDVNQNGELAILDLTGRTVATKPVATGGRSHLVTGVHDRLIITPQDPTRRIRIYRCDLQETRSISFDVPQLSEDRKWVSNRLLPLESSYLLTISDFGSDDRALVAFDSLGALKRDTIINAPFAFVAVTPDGHHAVAVRYTGQSEIVVYSVTQSADGVTPRD